MAGSARSREFRSRANTLGISQAVLDALIDKLESSSQSASAARSALRIPFRRLALPMNIYHSDGSRSVIQVACRNISSGGIAILHSSYMHVGSICEVILPRAGLSAVPVSGRVVRCRHVGGKVHEIGIKFNKPVEPRQFSAPNEGDLRRVLDAVNPTEFSAKILLSVADESLRRHVVRLLEETKASVQIWNGGKTATKPDVLVCELPAPGANVAETLIQLAQTAADAPVVMILPNYDPATVVRMKEFAPDGVVDQPVDLMGLCRGMVEAMIFSTR